MLWDSHHQFSGFNMLKIVEGERLVKLGMASGATGPPYRPGIFP